MRTLFEAMAVPIVAVHGSWHVRPCTTGRPSSSGESAVNRKPWPEMAGRARAELLVEYINMVERSAHQLPANTPEFDAHKGTTVEDVDAPGKWNSHLSDYGATFSTMHDALTKLAPTAAGEGVPRSAYVSRSHRDLTYGPTEQVDDNPYVIC